MADEILTPEQCRAARALVDMSQQELCERAGISQKPLVDFERGKTSPYPRTLDSLRRALEKTGVEFIDEKNGGGAGVRLKKNSGKRRTS